MLLNFSFISRIIPLILFFSFGLQNCNKNTSKKQKERFPKSIAKIKEMYNEGKYRDLLDILIKNKKRLAKSPQFWNMFGLTLRINSYLDKDPELRKDEIKAFRQALKLKPDFTEARFNLATSLWETEHIKEACKEYAEVLKAAPDHPDKKNLLFRLQKCKPKRKKSTEAKTKSTSDKKITDTKNVTTIKTPQKTGDTTKNVPNNPTKNNKQTQTKAGLKKSPSTDDKNKKEPINKPKTSKISDKNTINKTSHN